MNLISSAHVRLSQRARLAALVGCLLVAAPLAAFAGGSHSKTTSIISTHGYSTDDRGGGFAWGLLDPADGTTTSNTDGEDWRELQRLMRDEDLPVFWFRRDGRNYLVRDQGLVAHAMELAEPLHELGRQQGALGGKQGALGGRQAGLGARQAALGAQQARLSSRLVGLSSYRSNDDARAARRRERREIEAALDELSEQQTALGREQAPLGRLQAELGQEQAALGREQAQLSKRIGEELRRLAEDAVKSGKAVPVRALKSL